MVAAKITLTVANGTHSGKQFVFSSPAHCVAGRADDCSVRLAGAFEDGMVSRHHCAIDVNPPHIYVRDLGSRNGTYLNGRRIGRRDIDPAPDPENDTAVIPVEHELHDGDMLRLGPIPMLVTISPRPEGDREASGVGRGA
jgi:pSer/pThr/pTyr-binding forkhead associated (FHA) protein